MDDLAAPEGVDVDPKLRHVNSISNPEWKYSRRMYLPVFDLLRHRQKCLFDVGSALGRSFEEWNSELIREFLLRESVVYQNGTSGR